MRLLHKVVKSSMVFQTDKFVTIDNNVVLNNTQIDISDNKGTISQLEIQQRIDAEVNRRLSALEKQIRDKELKALDDIETRKGKIISDAMAQAERIRKEAEVMVIVERETANAKGRDEGIKQGIAEGLATLQKQLNALETLINDINDSKASYLASFDNELIDISIDMAKKILHSEITVNKDVVLNIAREACKNFRNSDYVKVSFAGCDVDKTVITDKDFISKISDSINDIRIEILPNAEQGTVIIDNDKEIIDASVPTQLEFLQEIMNTTKKNK